MTLWRLEWLRLVRTRRLIAILAIYVFFGITGPIAARFLGQIINQVGTGEIKVELPPPRPADGIAQFESNATQLGLFVVVLVAASALAFDARREMAVFLRTRIRGVADILLPAYLLNTAAAIVGLLAGALTAWYETAVLLGGVPVWRMLLGIGCGALFLAFAVAVAAVSAALARGLLATVGLTVLLLLGLAVLANLGGLHWWLPSALASAMTDLVNGGDPAKYLPAIVATAIATPAALLAASARAARREL